MRDGGKFLWLAVLILLAGAVLRFGVVTVHGLDGDDGFSLRVTQEHTAGDFIRTIGWADEIDQHPKVYFLLLDLWVEVAGTSRVALRGLNILLDVLLAAVLMQSARVLFNGRVALIAGVLWAVNPLLIWTTGLVRMYALLAVLATLTWLFLLRALHDGRPRWWALFALAALGAAYTQILGAVVLLAAGVIIVSWAVLRRRWTGLLVIGGVGVAYLPYALQMWGRSGSRSLLAVNPPANALDYGQALIAGLLANRPPLPVIWLGALALLAVGLLIAAGIAARRQPAGWLLLGLLGIAVAGFTFFFVYSDIFQPKFFAFITPLFLLALALGIDRLPDVRLRGGAVLALAVAGVVGLGYQLQPSAWEDFPAAADFVVAHGDAGDLVIVMSNHGGPPFRYHYDGPSRVIDPWFGISADMPLDDLLTFNIEGYDTAWLIFYQEAIFDPQGLLDGWFRARFPVRTEVYPSRANVRAYDLRPMTETLPPEAVPLDAQFDDRVALRGYQVYVPDVAARENRLHPPSGWLHVTLYWEALQPGVDFVPQVQLEDEIGQAWGGALPQENDVFALHPAITWQPGQIWRADVDLNLNPDTPPGSYKIVARICGADGSGPWSTTGADAGAGWVIVDRLPVR